MNGTLSAITTKKIDGFDGVSIIEFTDDNRIKSVKEFESKKEHIYPYGK